MHASLHRLCEECKSHNFSQTGWYGMAWQNERWWWWKIKEMLCVYLQDEFIGTIIIISPFRHHNTTCNHNSYGKVTSSYDSLRAYACHKCKKMFHFYLFLLRMNSFVCKLLSALRQCERIHNEKWCWKFHIKMIIKKNCTKMSWSLSCCCLFMLSFQYHVMTDTSNG